MQFKECPATVKAASDGAEGQFTAIVSVFSNKDSMGDVVQPGAFTDSLAEWKASGNPIPVIWSHDWSDPFSHIGAVSDAQETDKGLQITAQLDMDNPKAAQVFNLLKAGRVTQFSFAYDIVEGAFVDTEDDAYYELRKLQLIETGPTLLGANQETELLAVKAHALADGLKEGRVLAQKHVDALKDAHTTLGAVITAAEKTSAPDEGDGKGASAPARQDEGRPATDPDAAAKAAAEGEKSGPAVLDLMARRLEIRREHGHGHAA